MIDTISSEYIRLAFALDQHVEGFVDAYFGPPALRPVTAPQEPAAISAALTALRENLRASSYPPRRKAYLDLQLRGMAATAAKLAGAELAYRDEVRACFDIEPQLVAEEHFAAVLAELDTLLPGAGTLAERMTAWKQQFEVPPATARQLIDVILAEARRRTAEFVDLPARDAVEVALVSDQPWSGYNWFLGAARSRIDINTDLPIRANSLLDLVCHEAYPGHHTEHALKEQLLYHERGWGEHAIQLINTPECVISEGIATLAATLIFGETATEWAAEYVYPLAGITGDPERERRINQAAWQLRAVSGNAALLLHEQNADPDEVVTYLMRYSLRSEREARQQLRFISTPLWRTYVFTYYAGRDLLERWINRGDRHQRFHTLLTEQVYPSLVEGWLLAEEQQCPRD